MSKKKVSIHVRLSEEERDKLVRDAELCGLSQAEYLRQLCKGGTPKPKPPKELWEFLNTLYEVHGAMKTCTVYGPSALSACREVENLILLLQEVG